MPGQADPWWDELKEEAELPPPPPRSRIPAILGLAAALTASAGLAWWLALPERPAFQNSAVTQVQPQAAVVRAASPQADAEQVRRAYEDFGSVYSDGGEPALARFSDSCRESLKADPRILDFCLAFELFADAVRTDAGTPGKAEAERLAMAQAALPAGADADQRIRQVQAIMRAVTGSPEVQEAAVPAAAPPPAVEKAPDVITARPPQRDLQKASAPAPVQAKPVKVAAVAKAKPKAEACRLRSTPADRLICAYPQLAIQHRQMRQAYEKALAAGADPLTVDAAQADWRALRNSASTRAELSMLYTQRIRQLEAAATAPRPEEPPS
jgi:hypothetical protein